MYSMATPLSGKTAPKSAEVRALAITLRTSGMTYRAIAKKLDLHLDQAYRLCNTIPDKITIDTLRLSERVKAHLCDKALHTANLCLTRATDDDKLDKASTYQLVMSSAVMIDKHRLLSGESTATVEVLVGHQQELDAEAIEVEARIQAIKAELAKTQSQPTLSAGTYST